MDTVITSAPLTNGVEYKPVAAVRASEQSCCSLIRTERYKNVISAQYLYGALIVLYYFVYSISTFAGLQQHAAELRINLQSVDSFFSFFSPPPL